MGKKGEKTKKNLGGANGCRQRQSYCKCGTHKRPFKAEDSTFHRQQMATDTHRGLEKVNGSWVSIRTDR